MWYIFPQIQGLGRSSPSRVYAIRSLDEARAFLEDPYLGKNLTDICRALLELKSNNAREIFDGPDDKKLHSSMTLFELVADGNQVFRQVLDKFFRGERDWRTLEKLDRRTL